MDGLMSSNNNTMSVSNITNNTPPPPPSSSPSTITNNNNVVINTTVINTAGNHYVNNLGNNIPNVANTINNCTTTAATTSLNNFTSTAAATVAGTSEDTEMRHRFKVVKLVSSQPYTRGRWTCFDYNDENQNTINISKNAPANKILTNEHMDSSSMNDQNCNAVSNNTNAGDQGEVAIDNKIEQAMDLVKSHLMFAVREEVDVLKERIKELESDIQILMAHATPETLALLSTNRCSSANASINQQANVNNINNHSNTIPNINVNSNDS